MSILDSMTEDKLALVASAIRKWTNQLEHAGLPPMNMVSQAEANAVLDLMDKCPKIITETEPCEG